MGAYSVPGTGLAAEGTESEGVAVLEGERQDRKSAGHSLGMGSPSSGLAGGGEGAVHGIKDTKAHDGMGLLEQR